MLRIKYVEAFRDGEPYVVVISDKEGFIRAARFFENKQGALLHDNAVTEFSDIGSLDNDMLYLNDQECLEVATLFKEVISSHQPSHVYFDIDALGAEIEVLISYLEYSDLF